MPSRRAVRTPPVLRSAPEAPWCVLRITTSRSVPFSVGPEPIPLEGGTIVAAGAERLELRVPGGGATVNDVAVHGVTLLHPGDLVSLRDNHYLVFRSLGPSARPDPLLEHKEWARRVEDEIHSTGGPFAVLLGRSNAFARELVTAHYASVREIGRFVPAAFSRGGLELLVFGDHTLLDRVRTGFSDLAIRQDETVRWGSASFPKDGGTAEELWSVAMDRLLGLDVASAERSWADPVMSRLRSLTEVFARRRMLALVGAEGSGRETLVRLLRGALGAEAPFVVHRAARFDPQRWAEDAARARGGSLHIRRPEILPAPELRAFREASSFLPSAAFSEAESPSWNADNMILVPGLVDRPTDVAWISERVLHSVDAQLGRRRSRLGPQARNALEALPMPENVRTLQNVVVRGALNSEAGDFDPENLEALVEVPSTKDVRSKLRDTERKVIERTLEQSKWNVTEAARRMNLPRRTLVYRMKRLELRRPQR